MIQHLARQERNNKIVKDTRAKRKAGVFLFNSTRRTLHMPAHSPIIFQVHSYDLTWPAPTSQCNSLELPKSKVNSCLQAQKDKLLLINGKSCLLCLTFQQQFLEIKSFPWHIRIGQCFLLQRHLQEHSQGNCYQHCSRH